MVRNPLSVAVRWLRSIWRRVWTWIWLPHHRKMVKLGLPCEVCSKEMYHISLQTSASPARITRWLKERR